ncbi:putative reverse transcriptase domain-containing protein [Tanacetum coccineum]|uniref:Reverse transcriptase domain-containing protein n=1 Tax=Tanacetum coccineum TaxID=301880 RepID=A0ABQ5BUV2_9ASTR
MDDPNMTMEEYIRLKEEKAHRRVKVYNWETATYGKIWYNKDVYDLRSIETEFPAIIFNDNLISNETHFCKPTVSSLNDEIDFRISFDESEDDDYMPTVSCLNDLDFFKDFEKKFLAVVYNDALTSKLDFLTEPTVSPQHIDEFNLKNETSLSECDEEEQNVLNFNDLFLFNVIYPNDSKSDKENDDDKVDIEHSSGDLSVKPLPDVINTDVGAYAHGSNKLLEISINMAYPGEWIRHIDFLYNFRIAVITEYLVNISKRRAFWSLNEDILKITILKTNMPYPSRKIRRIRACTHQRPQRKEDQYAVLKIGAIPSKTAADAKVAIQEMAEYSQSIMEHLDIKEILGDITQRDIKEILGDTTQRDIKEILGDTTQIDIKEILGDTTQIDIKEILGDTTQIDIEEFLMKAQKANHRLYDIGCYNDNLSLMLAPESGEMIRLAQESRSKLKVIPTTSVSRPHLKSNQLEDRVMHNNSQGKKQQVEDHSHRDNSIHRQLWVSKYMTGNLKLLSNFMEKFLGTVKFGNDQIAFMVGYGDLVQGNITIKRVYYVEGMNHNLFSVGQFCSRGTNLYSITLQYTSTPNPICLMAKASSSQEWLWDRRLSHLNFDTINLISKYDILIGLSKLKFIKDYLCSSCELGKVKRVKVMVVSVTWSTAAAVVVGMVVVECVGGGCDGDERPSTSHYHFSRPQLKSNRLEDRVMHNNSEGKKQQVEDHRRNFKFSNHKTSVTACNDSLNAKTSNVNFVCVTCIKCVLNDNHDMCVLHYINGVNSRTKMPMAVPISTREPKRTVNQSTATPLKRTVPTGIKVVVWIKVVIRVAW